MDSPGYIVLSRLAAQGRASAVTAHNLANADTPGFRASRPVFAEYVQQQGRVAGPASGRSVGLRLGPGELARRGAGRGPAHRQPARRRHHRRGYFAVEDRRGERFTRAGRFALGADGRLVDGEGNAVLGQDSRPVAVAPATPGSRSWATAPSARRTACSGGCAWCASPTSSG
jgi:flagellar basal-body rod protein FlgF